MIPLAFECADVSEGQALHCHDEVELFSVSGGTGVLRVGRRQFATAPGKVTVVAPQDLHAGSPSGGSFSVRGLSVPCSLLDALGVSWSLGLRSTGDCESAPALSAFDTLLAGLQQRHSRLTCESLLIALFRCLGAPQAKDGGRESVRVAAAVDLLRERLGEDLSLRELAAAVQLTPQYLCKAFRLQTGLPPHAYRTRLRVARAITLLRQGMPPSEAAAAVGFFDQSHLTRHMRAQTGMTPAKVRAEANPVLERCESAR